MRLLNGKKIIALLMIMLLSLMLSACGQSGNAEKENQDQVQGAKEDPIRIGVFNWAENIAAVNVWKILLEEQGYNVELVNGEKAILFAGVAEGDLDLALEVWLPNTDGPFYNQYKENWENLGAWYKGTGLGLVVPSYVDVNNIEELNNNKDKFLKDGKASIIGIESGASLMRMTEEAIEEYGLEYNLIEGSEPAMMATLKSFYDKEKPVLVTLWNPHWAFADYDLKYLEDPKNIYGDEEEIISVAHKGFTEKYPNVAKWFNQWEMDDESLGRLMAIINDNGDPAEGAKLWIEDNRDLVEEWIK